MVRSFFLFTILGAELRFSNWHADWERGNTCMLWVCIGGVAGDGSNGGDRVEWGKNVSRGTQDPHFSRLATPNSPKESRRPSSFVSVKFQWQRAAGLG